MYKSASRTYFIRHLLGALFRQRETIDYPREAIDIPDCYQGQVKIDIDKCRGCGMCTRTCPASAIALLALPNGGISLVIHHEACACCGICEIVCPAEAIRRMPTFCPGATGKESLCETWQQEAP